MNIAHPTELTPRKPLRLWPGVVAVMLQWLVIFVVPIVAPAATIYAVIGGVVGGLAVVVWWLLFTRASWSERLGAILLMAVAVFAAASGVWADALPAIVIAIAVTGLLMLVLQDVVPRTAIRRVSGPLQGLLALAFVTGLVALTGGLQSPFTFGFPLIVGAGALLVAATRGLRVALIEQKDIAAGTSSRSSRLIHGGLRYLEQRHPPLVHAMAPPA